MILPLDQILIDEDFNCRGKIRPIDVMDLVKDITDKGLIQPISVQKHSGEKPYKLLAGFRRYTAFQVMERTEIPVNVVEKEMTEIEARAFNLSENLMRRDLTIAQEARALARFEQLGVSSRDVATMVNKSSGWVMMRYRYLKLPELVQREIEAGIIKQAQIEDLYTIFRKKGEKECYAAVKRFKMLKDKGIPMQRILYPKKKKPKRHRARYEIFEAMSHIMDNLGPSFATACMGWCAGELSNGEFVREIKKEAKANGVEYKNPITWKN